PPASAPRTWAGCRSRRHGSPTPVHSCRLRPGACWRYDVGAPSRPAKVVSERKWTMRSRNPQIVAFGGGGFSMEKDGSLLDDYVLSLAGQAHPRVCFLPTASGDADHYVVRFYRRFSPE